MTEPANDKGTPFLIDAMGRFGADGVAVSWSDVERKTDPAIEAAIDATWREKQREAEEANRSLYNGRQGRLIQSAVGEDGELRLTIGETDYRDFVGTNLYNAHLHRTYGDAYFANVVGTSASVITADGYLVYGRRGERVLFHRGYLHTFGGTLEEEDQRADRRFDVFGAVRRELREECRVTDDEIVEIVCTGLARDRQIVQPELLFDAHISLTRRELLSRFDAASDEEHTALESCHDVPEGIVPFVERSAPVAPVAVGAMLLHGRGTFGHEWYERACCELFGDVPEQWG